MTDRPAEQGFGLMDGAEHREQSRLAAVEQENALIANGDQALFDGLMNGTAEKYRDADGNLKARMRGTGPHDY